LKTPIPTNEQINIEILKRPDPILFYDDIILFEDELDDNGISKMNVRIVSLIFFFYLFKFIYFLIFFFLKKRELCQDVFLFFFVSSLELMEF